MLSKLRAFLGFRSNAANVSIGKYPPIPHDKPEDNPQYDRLQSLYHVTADDSEWRDISARVQSLQAVEPFEDIWQTYVNLFGNVYRRYLPNPVSGGPQSSSPAWWADVYAPLSDLTLKLTIQTPAAVHPKVRRAFPVLLDECLNLIARADELQQKADAANSSAALLALELRAYLNEDHIFRSEVAGGKWSTVFTSTVSEYRQAYHDMLAAESKLSEIMEVALHNYGGNNRADAYDAGITQAFVSGSPMFSNSGTPIDIKNWDGTTQKASFLLSGAAGKIQSWNGGIELSLFKREFQATSFSVRKLRDMVTSASDKVHTINRDVDLQRETHNCAVKAAQSKILLACQPDGPLNFSAQAERHSNSLAEFVKELSVRLKALSEGLEEVFCINRPLSQTLKDLIDGHEVASSEVLAEARAWCLKSASFLLNRRKTDRVMTCVVSAKTENPGQWASNLILDLTVSPSQLGAGTEARIVACECIVEDSHDDFWPVSISVPPFSRFIHADGSETKNDQSDLSEIIRYIQSGPSRSLEYSQYAVEEVVNASPEGRWQLRVGVSAKGRSPHELIDVILRLQIVSGDRH